MTPALDTIQKIEAKHGVWAVVASLAIAGFCFVGNLYVNSMEQSRQDQLAALQQQHEMQTRTLQALQAINLTLMQFSSDSRTRNASLSASQ